MPRSLRRWFSRTFRQTDILIVCRKAARLYDHVHPNGVFTSACFAQAAEGTGLLGSPDGLEVRLLLRNLPFVSQLDTPGYWICAMYPDPIPFGWSWL